MEDNSSEDQHDLPEARRPYPWLVYSYENEEQQLFWSISDSNKSHITRIPELQNKRCWGSSYGWYVLSDCNEINSSLFLWNLVTKEKIQLPELKVDYEIGYCILLSDQTVGFKWDIMLFVHRLPLIMFHSVGYDEDWTELNYREEVNRCLDEELERELVFVHPIKCNGKLYVESNTINKVFVIDEINKYKIVLQPLHLEGGRGMQNSYYGSRHFVESNGEIYGLDIWIDNFDVVDEIVGFGIYKLDFSCMAWKKVENIKDSLFFLSYRYSFSCPAIKPEIQGNRIYFCEDQNLYSYNVEDRSLLLLNPHFPNQPNHQKPSTSFWVMPHHPRLSLLKEEAEPNSSDFKELEKQEHGEEGDVHDDQVPYFSFLPLHINSLITNRLSLVHYLNFRSTCRLFRSLAPPILQHKLSLNGIKNPLLMFFEKETVCTFLDPQSGAKYYLKLPEQLLGCLICHCKDGWVLMSKSVTFTYCFNPFTGEILKFPDYNDIGYLQIRGTTLSISPTSSECLVVDIFIGNHSIWLYFARPGDTTWTSEEIAIDTNFVSTINSIVFYHGEFYYLGQEGDIGILRISDDDLVTWKVLSELQKPCKDYYKNFLVECDGSLLSIFVGEFKNGVKVFRLNQSSMSWSRVENLGKYMIYVSRQSSFSLMARTPGMENKIYFPKFYGEAIICYSLSTNQYHSVDNKDLAAGFYNTREQLYCAWVEPRWS